MSEKLLSNGLAERAGETRELLRLPFPKAEYDDKLSSIQAQIASARLAGAIIVDPENIYWLTGYRSMGYWTFQALFIPGQGGPVLISRNVNRGQALALPTIARFESVGDIDDPIAVLAGFLSGVTNPGARIGLETGGRNLSALAARTLERTASAEFVDWNGICERYRQVKTPQQLSLMREAAKAAVAGLDEAIMAIAPGRTENDVAAAMLGGLTRAGSDFVRVPLVVTGPATSLCFTTWERRVIEKGDVVLVEDAACISRYHAMIGRTCIVGRARNEHRKVANALIEMLDRAIAFIRPGVTSGAVNQVAHEVLIKHDLERHKAHRLGYSMGIAFPPNWAEGHFLDLKADDPTVLEPGMTFHVIPSLFAAEFGMWFSESVAVTESGCEVLTDYPRKLIELDF